MMVTSFFPGRIRLRESVFKDHAIVEECIKILKTSPAVKNIENNYATGSVLLEYDPEKVPVEKLQPLAPFFMQLDKLCHGYNASKQPEILAKLQEFKEIVAKW